MRGGQRLHQLGIWKRFIRSLLGVDRCGLSWASGRFILDPVCMGPDNTLRDLHELKKKSGFSGIPITGSDVEEGGEWLLRP